MSEEKQPESRPTTNDQTGESGGGTYPNPNRGKEPDASDFKGGQSDQAYYGGSQLGDDQLDENENAASRQH